MTGVYGSAGSARKGAATRTPTCALSITPETLAEKGFFAAKPAPPAPPSRCYLADGGPQRLQQIDHRLTASLSA